MALRLPRFVTTCGWFLVLTLVGAQLAGCDSSRPSEASPSPEPSTATDAKSESATAGPLFASLGNNAQGYEEYRHQKTGIIFVMLPGGKFNMGSPPTELGRRGDEGPVHAVALSPFLIAKHEVTQAQYAAVMEGHPTLSATPSSFSGDDRLPVEQVSWHDLKDDDGFLARTGLSLPTEAQWEYACRARRSTQFAFGGTITPEKVNYNGNFPYGSVPKGLHREKTSVVGSLPANGFGLHDLHGNVWEWCEDEYDSKCYSKLASRNGNKPCATGSGPRVARGGSWTNYARHCRSANRGNFPPNSRFSPLGFRVVKPLG